MDLLVHCGIGHKSKQHLRYLRKAIAGRILDETSQQLKILFSLKRSVTLVHCLIKIIFRPLSNQLIEERPAILVDQVLADISQNVKGIKEMDSIKLPVFLE
jgi:hypothetical protein